jgi:hypothetical protein
LNNPFRRKALTLSGAHATLGFSLFPCGKQLRP